MSERVSAVGWQQAVEQARGVSNAAQRQCHMSTALWTAAQKHAAISRGPHKSSRGEREFLVHSVIHDFCQQGYWTVRPYSVVKDWPGLRTSPLGVVPQQNRRSRLIVDYSFSAVNSETIKLAPSEAMHFCHALQRILTKIIHADPTYGPVMLGKIDIADGFYRVWVQIFDIPKLGVALPMAPDRLPLMAFPFALPMGWVESPPYFTTLTERSCNLANDTLREGRVSSQVHRLEDIAANASAGPVPHVLPRRWATSQAAFGPRLRRPPLGAVDVYVDDFLLLAQTQPTVTKVLCTALLAINAVVRPLSPQDSPVRKEPTSVKKLLQGNPRKTILGWHVDTVAGTFSLPLHRLDRLYELLDTVRPLDKGCLHNSGTKFLARSCAPWRSPCQAPAVSFRHCRMHSAVPTETECA